MRGLVPGGWEADQGLSFNTSSVEALAKTKDSLVRLCLLAGLEILSVSPPPPTELAEVVGVREV